jgi:hypothetical protein
VNALRLVVYDRTDRVGIRRGHDRGAASVEVGLSPAWWAGTKLHALLRTQPYRSLGAESWQQALRFAIEAANETGLPISELQAWGHGGWGYMDIGDSRLSTRGFAELGPLLDELRARMTPDAQLWLRCCSAFGGREGRKFAPALAERIGRRVVGHTFVIGIPQSGTHSLLPGQTPDWPLEEGVVMKDGEPARSKSSSFFAPNTVSFLRLDLPLGW